MILVKLQLLINPPKNLSIRNIKPENCSRLYQKDNKSKSNRGMSES